MLSSVKKHVLESECDKNLTVIKNVKQAFLRQLRIYKGKRRKLTILDDVSGIIRPSR